MWRRKNSETKIVKKKLVQNSKTDIVTKFKNLKCIKTQELELYQNSKTWVGTKLNSKFKQFQKPSIKSDTLTDSSCSIINVAYPI